ncbi:MAG TPA: heparinase II/III family protein, partial [Armatimonadota bacterium]|nr:heparinase II/III family protein [Armatimonadota bacterium]
MTTACAMALGLILVAPVAAQSAHPRIFITADDVPRLRAMADDNQTNALGFAPAEEWLTIKAQADTFANADPYHYGVDMPGKNGGPKQRFEYTLSDAPPPRHDEFSHYPPWTAMFQERSDTITTRLKYLLLAHQVSGDPVYFTRAKEIVLHMCAWPGIWTDPSYGGGKPCLDTGHAATWVGIFYDWSHDQLTVDERALIRESLAEKALAPIDEIMDGIAPYHNYTAVIASGLCIGAIALLGEDDRAEAWVDHAVARATLNFDAQGMDGGAMEGPMYGDYAANAFADMLWALGSAEIENALVEHEYIKSLPRYCISLLNPNNFQQPCFGDGGPGVGFGRLMLTLALRGDNEAAWFCKKGGAFTPDSPRGFMALDASKLHPTEPTWNPSDAFVDVGYAILRDGYKAGTGFLAFKCGPPESKIGHNHFDHNSFVINYGGTWCAWDPGYRNYFDPAARKYTTSSLGHNTVVLDFGDEYLEDMNYAIP